MAFDPGTGDLVLFDFDTHQHTRLLRRHLDVDGSTWTKRDPTNSPKAVVGVSMAYDPASGDMILFGGEGYTGDVSTTWAWNGATWSKLAPTTHPTARTGASMAFDASIGEMVLFGGYDTGTYLADTWTWDGSDWAKQLPAKSPTDRVGAAMAYDPGTGDVVLTGGFTQTGGATWYGDTWTWDGTTWAKLSTGPGGAHGHKRVDRLRPGGGGAGAVGRVRRIDHILHGHLDLERQHLGPASPVHQPAGPRHPDHGL